MNDVKKRSGFSLIELSIILAVMGILMAGLLSSNTVRRDKSSLTTTQDYMQEIQNALAIFYQKRGYLPCPASGTTALSTAEFGQATNCNAPSAGGTTDIVPADGAASDEVRVGVIPTRALSLPDHYMFDRWGNRISYAVIKKMATTKSSFDGFTTALTDGVIAIEDATGTLTSGGTVTDITGYVLFSAGKNKSGAYTKFGVGSNCNLSELDGRNCDNDARFTAAKIIDTSPGTMGFYDDVMKSETRPALISTVSNTGSSSSSGGGS